MALASCGYLHALCMKRAWKCGKKSTFFIMRGKGTIFGTVTHRSHIYGDS